MLTDYDIRERLLQVIQNQNKNTNYRVIEELVICDGAARVDVALANGQLHAFEIKSDHDSLHRLPKQIKYYDKTFDKCTIIIGEKFLDVIHEEVPEHWGIEFAYRNKFGNVTIKRVRSSKRNHKVKATNLLDLIWGDEIKSYLKKNKIRGYSNKNKSGLKKLTINYIPLQDIRHFTRETLKTRTGWREDLP